MCSRGSGHQIYIGTIDFHFYPLPLFTSRNQVIQPQADFGGFLYKGWKQCLRLLYGFEILSTKSYLLLTSGCSCESHPLWNIPSAEVRKNNMRYCTLWQKPYNVKNEKCPLLPHLCTAFRSQWTSKIILEERNKTDILDWKCQKISTFAQRRCGCPLPGGVQGQVGWSSEQPDLVEDVPAHGRGSGTRWSLRSLPN